MIDSTVHVADIHVASKFFIASLLLFYAISVLHNDRKIQIQSTYIIKIHGLVAALLLHETEC